MLAQQLAINPQRPVKEQRPQRWWSGLLPGCGRRPSGGNCAGAWDPHAGEGAERKVHFGAKLTKQFEGSRLENNGTPVMANCQAGTTLPGKGKVPTRSRPGSTARGSFGNGGAFTVCIRPDLYAGQGTPL